MTRRIVMACVGVVAAVGVASAQPPANGPALRFKWQPGHTLTYKVNQATAVQETTLDEKTEQPVTTDVRTNLTLTRQWEVKAVDAAGTATLEMRITALKNEIRQPDGNTITRDSANPDHAKEMAGYLNTPVVTVRVDARGQLVEVKEAKAGSAERLRAELPFRLTLPETGPTVGQTWDRTFSLKLDPPHGTGESHEFVQKYACKSLDNGLAAVGVETALKASPSTTGEQVPLVPMLWRGEVYFSIETGTYHAARLKTRTELPDHLGQGTKFVYESTYTEDVVK